MSVRKIAVNLGLSPSTVSLAMNLNPKIPAKTRARVFKEAERIGYQPNGNVRQLMSQVRRANHKDALGCMGVFSFYGGFEPWKQSKHYNRIYDSMEKRAKRLGYQLDAVNLAEKGMTTKRFASILEARGIEGLLCFGSPDFDQQIPPELHHFAIVSIGLSIRTPLHRVTAHFYNGLMNTLNKVYDMGYRRPGLVLGKFEETRSQFAYPAAYYGWVKHKLGSRDFIIPILRTDSMNADELIGWYDNHQPDVIVVVHLHREVEKIPAIFDAKGIKTPQDVGLAAVTQLLDGTNISGMQQNQQLMGEWAVEMLDSRMAYQDFGIPEHPRVEMVESSWMSGETLKTQT